MAGLSDTDSASRVSHFKLGRLTTELQWQALLKSLPIAVYMTDAQGWMTFYNDAAAQLWGIEPEIGKSRFGGAWKLLRSDGSVLPQEESPLAVSLRERRSVLGVDTIAERPDGSRVHFIPHPMPLFGASGEMTGAINILIDITERYQAHEAAQRLAAIVESSEDAILAKDLDGMITAWNVGAQRLFGYAVEEVVGRPITILVPLDRHSEEGRILERIRAGDRVDRSETVRRRKDGSLVDVSLSISPIRDADGRIVGASSIVRDITEQRRAQERQLLLLREMSHRVKNVFALAGAMVSLSAKSSASVEEITAAVRGRLGALARAHDLTLADIGRGQAMTPTTLHALIQTIASPYESALGERVAVSGPDFAVDGHAVTGLALVFNELMTNAAKYGGLVAPEGRIAVALARLGDDLRLHWRERGGPNVRAPDADGFGTWLLDGTIKGQLHGSVSRTWHASGLELEMAVPLSQLTATAG
jgi:PAS domain S-box-containing protein